MDIFAFSATSFLSFLMTLMRVSLVVFLLPFFGGNSIPNQVKFSVAIVFTLSIWPHLSLPGEMMPGHPLGIILYIVAELLLGLILGLCVHFIFAGIQTGGELLGMHMGFTMVTLADPSSGAQVGMTSHLMNNVAMVIFLVFDGHLHLLRALTDSFVLIPPGGIVITPNLVTDVLELSKQMFVLAVQIAAPVIAAILMAELGLALVSRAAPQMNMMTLGFPLKIAVGFYFISLLFTSVAALMEDIVVGLGPMFINIMRTAS